MTRQISSCVQKLSTAVTVASLMLDNNTFACDKRFTVIIQACPVNNKQPLPQKALDQAKKQADDIVLCEIMCCCTSVPSKSARKKGDGKQQCVDDVVTESQRQQNGNSRYRSEIDYDMKKSARDNPDRDTENPRPIVHRDPNTRKETHYKTTHLPTRAHNEVENFIAKKGYIRRPDIVIVRDRNKQADVDNIERIIEMKFKNDIENYAATKDYRRIANNNYTLMEENKECVCDDNNDKILEPILAAKKEEKQNSIDTTAESPSMSARLGYFGLGILAGVATIAAVLIPFDGPAGEIVLGGAAIGSFSAAFQ